jgi:transposase
MRQITFTDEPVRQLVHESIYHNHHLIRRKMLTLFLKAQGYAHHEIADLIQISPTTLRTYLDQFTAGGVDGLKPLHYAGNPNRLDEQRAAIIAHLEAAPPATLKEAQAKIEEASQLKRSLPQVRAFLQRHKLRRRKMKQLPKDGDPAWLTAQETFKIEQLEPLMKQAQEHTLHLFFVDAAHFVLLPCLGYLYSLVVRYLPSSPGRQRFNVLGALHAFSHELVTITNATYINAAAVCALLEKLAAQFQDLPIVLILDSFCPKKGLSGIWEHRMADHSFT